MSISESGRLKVLCRKTEMCAFFQRGQCNRGGTCNFAHDAAEIRSKPDLQRTKPCPSMAATGRCDVVECPFAHKTGEMRKFRPTGCARGSSRSEERLESQSPSNSPGKSPSKGRSPDKGRHGNKGMPKFPRAGGSSTFDKTQFNCQPSAGPKNDINAGGGSIRPMRKGFNSQPVTVTKKYDSATDGSSRAMRCSKALGETPPDRAPSAEIGMNAYSSWSRQSTAASESDQGLEARFFKARLCFYFMTGVCKKDACTFAHGECELRAPPETADPEAPRFDELKEPELDEPKVPEPAKNHTEAEATRQLPHDVVPTSPLPRKSPSVQSWPTWGSLPILAGSSGTTAAETEHRRPRPLLLLSRELGTRSSANDDTDASSDTEWAGVSEDSPHPERFNSKSSRERHSRRTSLSDTDMPSPSEAHNFDTSCLVVKNTFLSVKDEEQREPRRRRASC